MLCTCMRFFSDLFELWNGGWENVVVVVVDDDGGVGGVEGRGGQEGLPIFFQSGVERRRRNR